MGEVYLQNASVYHWKLEVYEWRVNVSTVMCRPAMRVHLSTRVIVRICRVIFNWHIFQFSQTECTIVLWTASTDFRLGKSWGHEALQWSSFAELFQRTEERWASQEFISVIINPDVLRRQHWWPDTLVPEEGTHRAAFIIGIPASSVGVTGSCNVSLDREKNPYRVIWDSLL